MNEQTRNEIIHRWQRGQSQREIAKQLRVSRNTVKAVLDHMHQARDHGVTHDRPPQCYKRTRVLDPFDEKLKEILSRYPELPVVDIFRRLQDLGYTASYTTLRLRVKELRRSIKHQHAIQATSGLAIAQVSYQPLAFRLSDGTPLRTCMFRFELLHCKREFLHVSTRVDLATAMHQHLLAFEYFGGVPVSIVYPDAPRVLHYRNGDATPGGFSDTFLRFASHYGFFPKTAAADETGSVPFHGESQSVPDSSALDLQGQVIESVDQANDRLRRWVRDVSDARLHEGQSPVERFKQEQPHLIALPQQTWCG